MNTRIEIKLLIVRVGKCATLESVNSCINYSHTISAMFTLENFQSQTEQLFIDAIAGIQQQFFMKFSTKMSQAQCQQYFDIF